MKTSIKNKGNSTIEIEVEVPAEDFKEYIEKSIISFQTEVEAEGFRKGRAPENIVRQKVGEENILNNAAQLAVSDAFSSVTKEHNLETVGQPDVQITKLAEGNPLEFVIKVSTVPEITLPDYKSIAEKVEIKEAKVTNEDVEKALDWLKKNKKGEDGKEPELTDEFAKTIGNFENMEALKKNITEGLKQEKEVGEKQRVRQEILEKIAKETKMDIPKELLENEKKNMLENIKQGVVQTLKMEFTEYLSKIKKTEQELLDSFKDEAEKRVKNYLLLREISKKEEVTPTKEEMDQEMQKVLRQYQTPEEAEKNIDMEQLKEYTELVLKNEKTLELLESYIK